MKINIGEIPDEGISLDIPRDDAEATLLERAFAASGLPVRGGAEASLQIGRADGGVYINGTASADVAFDCARCLAAFSTRVSSSFTLLSGTGADEGDFDIMGEEIDLVPILAEQLTLELPIKPLCSDACRGLCPRCGADLNTETCSCEAGPAVDPRLLKLKDFKPKPKK